jgi:hypothetical protein
MTSLTLPRQVKSLTTFTLVLLFLSLIACKTKQASTPCFNYPKQIDSLQVRDLYDTARLYLFTWLCDKKIDDYYRGQFDLEYESFFMRNDSLEIFFTHSLPKELQDSTTISEYFHRPSMAFNMKTRQKLWGWDINGFSAALDPGDERFESPASGKVVNFIKKHKQILNPCFLELARKAKVIAE